MHWNGVYEHLHRDLREFVNAAGEPVPYDFNGVVHLMLALLDNLRHNASDPELEQLRQSMTEEQAVFFLKLAEYVRQTA